MKCTLQKWMASFRCSNVGEYLTISFIFCYVVLLIPAPVLAVVQETNVYERVSALTNQQNEAISFFSSRLHIHYCNWSYLQRGVMIIHIKRNPHVK